MSGEYLRNPMHNNWKRVSSLPCEYRFGKDRRSLTVDYARTDQVEQCRKMIDEAAKRGDNVGVDEYEEGGDKTEYLFELSEVFQATDPSTGRIEAFMFAQVCLFQRPFDSCSTTLIVFRSADLDDVAYAQLMRLTANFARELDAGCMQCYVNVSLTMPMLQLELRRQGFVTVAVVPECVEIAGVGVRENAIMYINLVSEDREVESEANILELMKSYFPPETVLQDYTNAELQQVPGLPKTFRTRHNQSVIIRNISKNEDERIYQMLFDATEEGDGFSAHEFPTLDAFRVMMLAYGFAVAFEIENTRELIGYYMFNESEMSRRRTGKIGEDTMLIKAEYRGQGYAGEILAFGRNFARSFGYKCVFHDTLATNGVAISMWRRLKLRVLGVLPRGAYQVGNGWVDVLITMESLEATSNDQRFQNEKSNKTDGHNETSKL